MDISYAFDMVCETNIIIAWERFIFGTPGNATALPVPPSQMGGLKDFFI